MTATKTTKPGKDGSGASYTQGMATESVGTDLTPFHYLCEPVGETIITPAQDGTDGTGITPPTGAAGIRGWLSGIYNKLTGTVAVSAASLPLPSGAATSALQTTINTTLGSPMQATGGSVTANAGTNLNTSTLAKESGGNLATVATAQGVSGTGITQPTGGSGLLGWLSGIYSALLSIATDVSSSIPAGSALIGITGIDQTTPGTTNAVAFTTPGRTPASTNSQAGNTAIAASVPAVAGQYSYLSGMFIAGLGATAASVVACNITNILASDAGSNTWHFNINVPAGVTVPLNNGLPIIINFDPPIQSKAVDTALQVNVGAFGAGNTQAVVSVWGYTSASATF